MNFGNELAFNIIPLSAQGYTVGAPFPLPPSLFINQESRLETLRHYNVLFREDAPPGSHQSELNLAAIASLFSQVSVGTGARSKRTIERPFWYNPKLDKAWIK